MKKSLIMMGVVGVFFQLFAKLPLEVAPTRAQMLLEAKLLLQKEIRLKNKKAAWQKRQMVLLDDFNKIYETDEQFGTKNLYWKKRFEKHQRDFYVSLQEKSDAIQEDMLEVKKHLASVKKQFSTFYAVPLTMEEIRRGTVPKVADKHEKIRLLQVYLSSTKSWKACRQKNKFFDNKRIDIANRTDFSAKKYEQSVAKLDNEVEKNYRQLDTYKQMSQNALREYRTKYGYQIKNEKVAKEILNNIKN